MSPVDQIELREALKAILEVIAERFRALDSRVDSLEAQAHKQPRKSFAQKLKGRNQ